MAGRDDIDIEVPVYKTNVILITNSARARAVLRLTSRTDDEVDEEMECAGWTYVIMGLLHVYVPRHSPVGVLAHECAHAAARILSDRGVKASPGDEAFTYLLEYLVGKAAPHVRPRLR